MNNKLIIFGAGKISEVVSFYINSERLYDICAYVIEDEFIDKKSFLGKPIIGLSEVLEKFPANIYKCLVAVGYQKNNKFRRDKFDFFKHNGYNFASYISKKINSEFKFGENVIIMDDAIIQPHVSIGNNVFIWGGAMVGHHSKVEDNCWITGGSMIGGSSTIGNSTFLGMGSVVGHEIIIKKNCFVGASALITKNLNENSVVITSDSTTHRLSTDQFLKISKML